MAAAAGDDVEWDPALESGYSENDDDDHIDEFDTVERVRIDGIDNGGVGDDIGGATDDEDGDGEHVSGDKRKPSDDDPNKDNEDDARAKKKKKKPPNTAPGEVRAFKPLTVSWDVEASGSVRLLSDVIQIGAVVIDDSGVPVVSDDTFVSTINPPNTVWTEEATAVHGLSRDMFIRTKAPTNAAAVWQKFFGWLEKMVRS